MSSIGEQLRAAREAKGLSISDIEKTTKIQSRYLEAIENNDFDKLPGDFYTRAFIRQYAQIVGLDGKELLSEYQGNTESNVSDDQSGSATQESSVDESSQETDEEESNKSEDSLPVNTSDDSQEVDTYQTNSDVQPDGSEPRWRGMVSKLAIGVAVVVVLVICVVFGSTLMHRNSSSNKDNASSSVTISSSKESSSSKSSSVSSKKKQNANPIRIRTLSNTAGSPSYRITGFSKNTNLVVRSSSQNIYYYVSTNGTIDNQGTLQSGEKHTESVKNGSTVVVYLGNDRGVSVSIGGKKIPFTPVNGTTRMTLYLGKSAGSSSNDTNTTTSSSNTQANTNQNTNTNTSSRQSSTRNYYNTNTSSYTTSSSTQNNTTSSEASESANDNNTTSSSENQTQQNTTTDQNNQNNQN